LQQNGHCVTWTSFSAEDALRRLEQEVPDVLLLDIFLPGGMDGVGIADIVNQRYSIPVIFVTGNSDPMTRKRAETVRPYAILIKPVSEAHLLKQIEGLIP
jgi:CheY-like chemotaxis protein